MKRRTLKDDLVVEGFGIHTGRLSRIRLHPAVNNGGAIHFLKNGKRIEASFDRVVDVRYATVLGEDGETVRTVEHLLSALYGAGITDAVVEVEGAEVPILDGSAKEFLELISQVGTEEIDRPRRVLRVVKPFEVRDEDGAYVRVEPSEELSVKCTISYQHCPYLRHQEIELAFSPEVYRSEIAPARTFCFYHQIASLLKSGLGRGGNYKNVVVVGDDGILNGPPRFEDEPVRHKVLDLIGDLALSGYYILGRVEAYKSGHALHNRFLREFLASDAYERL